MTFPTAAAISVQMFNLKKGIAGALRRQIHYFQYTYRVRFDDLGSSGVLFSLNCRSFKDTVLTAPVSSGLLQKQAYCLCNLHIRV